MPSNLLDRSTVAAENATDTVGRAIPSILRISAGLLWLSNVSWKTPTDFESLRNFTEAGVDDPVAPGYPELLDNVVLPNFTAFGWVVLFLEFLLAAALLSGCFTRLAAVGGFVQSIAIGLSVANAEDEWYWSYALMALLHLAVLVTASGRWPTTTVRWPAAAATATYGAVVAVANGGNGALSNDVSRGDDWVLFAGDRAFPDDFGRNVFGGTVTLGLLIVVLAVVVALLPGTQSARLLGGAVAAVSVLFVITYRGDTNVLGAKPSTAAVLLAVGLYLMGTTMPRRRLRTT